MCECCPKPRARGRQRKTDQEKKREKKKERETEAQIEKEIERDYIDTHRAFLILDKALLVALNGY